MQLPMCLFVYLFLSSLFCAVVSVCFGLFSPQIMLISPILYLSKRKLPRFHAHVFLLEILTMNSHLDLDVKLLSLNVRGLNKSIKRRSIFRWLHNQKLQFAFLQETYSSKSYAHIWEAEWGGKTFFSHGTSHSKGV